MEAFTIHSGKVAPMDRANVDTDLIIPKQFLKSVKRTGFGPNLFDPLRYLDEGQPGKDNSKRPTNPEFFLNQPRYRQSTILLARDNFGCGSSREHAPWALMDYGFRVVLAPSFADIFYNNCFKNGLLPIVLPADVIDQLFSKVTAGEIVEATVDLPNQQITAGTGVIIDFAIEDFRKECLVKGLDDIDLTLEKADLIKAYEAKRKEVCPWLFEDLA